MPPKLFEDDEDDSLQNEGIPKFEIDEDYGRRLEYNRKREDLQRYEELKKKGLINDDESDEDSEPDDDDVVVVNPVVDLKFFDLLLKVKRGDPSVKNKDVKFFESDESDEENGDSKKDHQKEKKKKLYLKDVQAKHLLEEGPEFVDEESDGGKERKVKTYTEQQDELRQALCDALEAGGTESDEDSGDLLRVTEKKGDDLVEDEELVKKVDEYFGEDAEVDEKQKFLKDFCLKQMCKEKDEQSKMAVIDEAVFEDLEEDFFALDMEEVYETNYRHEENAGETVMGQSRKVEGSVRKKDTARKTQRKSKEERVKIAEIERQEELKQLKNVKKKEIKEKMKKVLSIAGFKEGDECPLDAKDLDDEFDPEEYNKMMKAVFDDKYYGAEDSELISDEDCEKPDFDKEDELLGLPKDWDVIQGRDGFAAAREKALKHKDENVTDDEEAEEGNGSEEEEEEAAEEEEEEISEKGLEGKRKRKQKTSLVQRAKEALMEEYYKLDYEDTIGDLKTRFKYAKVQPNRFELETEEILGLDDTELNQYVPLKKIAPYVEKDWEVNKHKVREQKLRNKELLQKKGKQDEKGKKKRKNEEIVQKVDEEGETSKLSRKAKRRRRQAEKKLPPNRMAAYGKA